MLDTEQDWPIILTVGLTFLTGYFMFAQIRTCWGGKHAQVKTKAHSVEFSGGGLRRRRMGVSKGSRTHADEYPTSHARLPVEIWEKVIDCIAAGAQEDIRESLLTCAAVCRDWYPRSRLYLRQNLCLHKRSQLVSLIKLMHKYPESWLTPIVPVHTVSCSKFDLLAPFAAVAARRLTRIEGLSLKDAEWLPSMFHADAADVFLCLNTLTSIVRLELHNVVFPSGVVFGRLLCSLPRISLLLCDRVAFRAHGDTLGCILPPKNFRLAEIELSESYNAVELLNTTSILHFLKTLTVRHCSRNELKGPIQLLVDTARVSLARVHIECEDSEAPWFDRFPLDLRHNTGLQVLSITVFVEDTQFAGWLYNLLHGALRAELREIIITMRVQAWVVESGLTKLFHELLEDNLCATQLDPLLLRASAATLEAVTFELRAVAHRHEVDALKSVPTEDRWRNHFAYLFPGLSARGILRTPVAIEIC
ncbi:uncharacterized protein FIBRA_07544 [Fibroporia radiculosa]|uniref:F-box domain-containing protein n=1 Tax=Fibroporia radiculosa TaxID=599839 RepID=J4GV67_9APHY|nr:uncharacterized protein FIBRA_07544 [Fibroporia radiculosa]CCM05330.1 predicted protein [Fibroporia radiculosa]